MIRLSAGTAACLGLGRGRMDAFPTTAYLLLGDQCLMKCAFCPQGLGGSEPLRKLGRITWPEYKWTEVAESLARAEENGIRRICLQSVRHSDGIDSLVNRVGQIRSVSRLPLSLSAWIDSKEEAAALVSAGAHKISISIDVVNPEAYEKIKGGLLSDRLELIISCARSLPGQISTHLICGLGETEEELMVLIDRLIREEITVALFAFVPLKGTLLESRNPPAVDAYRRLQVGYYLLREKITALNSFSFEKGRLISYGLPGTDLLKNISAGSAFRTSGCPDCNRPYYNERPGGTIYNYHRPLSSDEKKAALEEVCQSLKI